MLWDSTSFLQNMQYRESTILKAFTVYHYQHWVVTKYDNFLLAVRSYVCTHHVLFTIFGKHNVHLWRLSSNYFRWTNTTRKEHLTAISFVNWHCWNLLIDLYKYKQNLQTDKNLREYIYLPTTGMRKVMFPITLFCHMTKQVVCFFFYVFCMWECYAL